MDVNALFRRWRRRLARIHADQIEPLVHRVVIFSLFQESRKPERKRPVHMNELADWMVGNLAAFTTNWIRKASEESPRNQLEGRKRPTFAQRRSVSLQLLLEEIREHAHIVTLTRCRRIVRPKAIADRAFRQLVGSSSSRLPEARVVSDMASIRRATHVIKRITDTQVAHTDQYPIGRTSWSEIKKATDILETTWLRYSAVIAGKRARIRVVPEDDAEKMIAAFRRMWGDT